MATGHLQQIASFLESLSPIPQDEWEDFFPCVTIKKYPRGDFFARTGDTSDSVGLVLKGVFRVYYVNDDGDFFVRNICKEGMPLGSYATILRGEASHVSIEALMDAEVAQFSFGELSRRFSQHPAWEKLGRRLAEEHYIARERREYQMMALDAAKRYQIFLETYPGLESQITQANIASYIGVRPETLSRMIKKMK